MEYEGPEDLGVGCGSGLAAGPTVESTWPRRAPVTMLQRGSSDLPCLRIVPVAAGDSKGSDRIECSNHICEVQFYALAFLASAVTAALVSSKDSSTQKMCRRLTARVKS